MATDSQIRDFLQAQPAAEVFSPYCYLNKEADALTVYFKDEADYSKRLCDHVTLFLSLHTDEIIGCRIKGIQALLEDLPNYIRVDHGKVALSILFFGFRGLSPDETVRQAFNQLGRAAAEREMVLEPI